MEEAALIRALRRGDPAALETLLIQYSPFAAAVAAHILRGCPQDTEEVVSDAFLALWDNAHKLRPGKVKAYLGTIVRNRAKNRLRQLGRDMTAALHGRGGGKPLCQQGRVQAAKGEIEVFFAGWK